MPRLLFITWPDTGGLAATVRLFTAWPLIFSDGMPG